MHVCGWIAGGGGSLSLSKFQYKDFLRRVIVDTWATKKRGQARLPDPELITVVLVISAGEAPKAKLIEQAEQSGGQEGGLPPLLSAAHLFCKQFCSGDTVRTDQLRHILAQVKLGRHGFASSLAHSRAQRRIAEQTQNTFAHRPSVAAVDKISGYAVRD